jgi:hypothetical protein
MSEVSQDEQEEREYQRRRALRALRVYFARKRWPRLMMSAVVLLTGGAGFLASYFLLHAGVERMALRYPLAVLIAWLVFLLLVRVWMELERRCFQPGEDIAALLKGHDPAEARQRLKDDDWSVLDWFDFTSGFDCGDGEGCAVWLVLVMLGALLFLALGAIFSVVAAAPILIAEVFLDAVLVAALFKRVRGLDQRWWLPGAARQTVLPVLATMLFLTAAGWMMQAAVPHARSIGDVWRHWQGTEEVPQR